MVAYPFYTARTQIRTSPKQSYIDDFEAIAELLFENAPNYYSVDDEYPVEHEVTYGETDFTEIAARVDSVVDARTGRTMGDDYKNFILLPTADKVFVGKKFRWKDNYWIAVNTNSHESLTNACVVRRCNNVLKWIDENGVLRTEPCAIDNNLTKNRDISLSTIVLNAGEILVHCQRNERTNLILPNRRFLFGTKENIKAYKIYGNGILNYLNNETSDNYSPSVLQIKMNANFDNTSNDDIINGIADAYINTYSITINQDDIQQSIGFTTTLTAKVYKAGVLVTDDVVWASSNTAVCTVSSSGVINCVSNGSATITASVENNSTITDTISITVTATPVAEYDIRITPNVYEVYEDSTVIFTCGLYLNEVLQPDVFTFEVLSSLPEYCYEFTSIGGNSFSIKNKLMNLTPLVVRCTSGIYREDFSFNLKGVF